MTLQYASRSAMNITDKNFLLFAMNFYSNYQCHGMEEFNEDLATTIHLKKLLTRYHQNGVLKERLIINHLISFFNVFEASAAGQMLFYKVDPEHYGYLKTFLVFLNRCPKSVTLNGKVLDIDKIPVDFKLYKKIEEGIMK